MCFIAIGTWFIIGRKSEVGQTEGIQNGAAAAQQQQMDNEEKVAPGGDDLQPDEITPSVDKDHDGAAAAANEDAKVTIIVMKYREILFCFMLKF